MTLESKFNRIQRQLRIYNPKTIDRANELLQLFGDAPDEEIQQAIERYIVSYQMSHEHRERLLRQVCKRFS